MSLLVVTNFASHYRAPLYALLAERLGAEFVFFSAGGEEYWQQHLGTTAGEFPSVTLAGGVRIGKFRLNTRLWRELWSREYDVVIKCMNGRLELPIAYIVARMRGAAFVLWTGMWMHPDTPFHRLSRPFARWVYRHADAIVTYGSHVSRFVVEEGADEARVFAADNATDNAAYGRTILAEEVGGTKASLGAQDRPVVLAVSRLVDQKGLDVLVDALAGLAEPKPLLAIIGTGPLDGSLCSRAEDGGVTLRLVGGIQPRELPPYYAAADVFVMPSVSTRTVKETWGLACNEAMLQGVPVVATDAVGAVAGRLVEHGVTGLVVPERDVCALTNAIEVLLTDEALAERLATAGRQRVQEIDYENMVGAFDAAIQMARRRRAASR